MKAIQRKIILLLFCCTFFVVFAVEIMGLGIMNRAIERDSTQIMKLLCAEQAGELNEYLHNVEQSVNTIYQVAVVGLESCENIFADRTVLEDYVSEMQEFSSMIVENTDGAIAVYYRFNPLLTDPRDGYFLIKSKETEEFIGFPTTDLSKYEATDEEHVSWYFDPLTAGKAIWMDPYSNENIDVEMISYVVPVYHNGQTIGVIGMDIDIVSWREKVAEISLYDTGFAFLMDSKGNVVYHPDFKEGIEASEAPTAVELLNYNMEEALKQEDSYAYKLDAQERAMVADRLDNGMSFAVVVPLQEINEPSRLLMMQTIFAAVAIIAVFSLFSIRICKKIIKVAYTDVMTGVKNKTAYEETVDAISQEMREKTAEFAVIMFDINNLKMINDTYGHVQGDHLIVSAVQVMKRVFGREKVFRIGGDEFVVILQHSETATLDEKLEEFNHELSIYNKEQKFVWGDIEIARGASMYNYKTDAAYGDVFRRADSLMYENKKLQKAQK